MSNIVGKDGSIIIGIEFEEKYIQTTCYNGKCFIIISEW